MGRGKIEIKRIENSSNRQVTYLTRRTGIIKKAKEITVLYNAKVSLVIFGTSGKMHRVHQPSTNLIDILDAYQRSTGKKLWDAKHGRRGVTYYIAGKMEKEGALMVKTNR